IYRARARGSGASGQPRSARTPRSRRRRSHHPLWFARRPHHGRVLRTWLARHRSESILPTSRRWSLNRGRLAHDVPERVGKGAGSGVSVRHDDATPARCGASRAMIGRALLCCAAGLAVHVTVAADQSPSFRTETRLVVLHATVLNDRGDRVTTLDQQAFTVYENGKRQPIALFRRDDIPISVGLLID